MNKILLTILLGSGVLTPAVAQHIRSGYVDRGIVSHEFPAAFKTWQKGDKWTDDDNFFISRVRPRVRFRNEATQVNPGLTEDIDKKLIFWVPINNETFNALPDGRFDSEVFPMWSYVTHYGNWSTPLIRMPGGFADVAHKNGVPVSVVASSPYGRLTAAWEAAYRAMAEAGPEKLADFMLYYGVDGIGYNSEFQGDATVVDGLNELHGATVKRMKAKGNPLAEFIWYDGTNSSGIISFDQGLGSHNQEIWGYGDHLRTALFLNYNWNNATLLRQSTENARALGRTPLDLYCGINMQGREPKNTKPGIWPLLAEYPLSIGLWGAHSENMFFEGRAEQGPAPAERQHSYMTRMLNWFVNGSHNPAADHELSNSLNHGVENTEFFGMSKLMSARSALCWSLNEEPFVTWFNLGNGRFFNYKGVRQHDAEWYNISMQDYLPTWQWWFATKFLGRGSENIAADGLKAEFTWDDAWIGGSSLRVHGTSGDEYLHLFKTEFGLTEGDEIIVRYKQLSGTGEAALAMSLKGNEETTLDESQLRLMGAGIESIPGCWTTRRFVVGKDVSVPQNGKLAMIALHFKNAEDLDIRLGELSIKRYSHLYVSVDRPEVESTALLNARHNGADGKIIFNMPNDKAPEVCYNTDVNVSMFKLWSQQEGSEPVLMGMTSSWAGLMFSAPFDGNRDSKIRFGVSALALNRISESEIAWGEWHRASDSYEISDEITVSSDNVHVGEPFSIGYADPAHEPATWTLIDENGAIVAEGEGTSLTLNEGLTKKGLYDLKLKGFEAAEDGRVETERLHRSFVSIYNSTDGSTPQILSLTPIGNVEGTENSEEDVEMIHEFPTGEVAYEFTADTGESSLSRGVKVGKEALGFRFAETGLTPLTSFTVSFWIRPETFDNDAVHLFNIRYKGDPWSYNHWGWMWHTLSADGRSASFTIRMKDGKDVDYHFDNLQLTPGAWVHLAYGFRFNEKGRVRPALFVNGKSEEITGCRINGQELRAPNLLGPAWEWHGENVVAIGGYLHKSGSVVGNVDNLMVWDHLLDEEEVRKAMGDFTPETLPEGVVGYFDFETEPESTGKFRNAGNGSFGVGLHGFIDTEVEGQGTLEWRQPEYGVGCPLLEGKAYTLTTSSSWETPGAVVKEVTGDASEGTIRLSYPRTGGVEEMSFGGYPVTLRLENEYGEDSRQALVRFPATDVKEVAQERPRVSVSPGVFEERISVLAPESGRLNVQMISMDGRVVCSCDFEAHEGEWLTLFPEVTAGTYIVTVTKEGRVIGSANALRK